MKKTRLFTPLLGLLALGLIFTSCEKEETVDSVDSAEEKLEDLPFKNYMVISKSTELTKSVEDFLKTKETKILQSIPEIGVAVVNSKAPNFASTTKKNKEILSVIPDYEVRWIPSDIGKPASIGDTEAYFNLKYLWGMDAINAPEAWDLGYTGEGASVFVLDSGIDPDHIDLSPNVNKELSVSFIEDEDWHIHDTIGFNHGTHVAGTIAAAQTGYGIIGVAPEAELVAVKVLSEVSGSGPFSAINAGIVYAAQNGADIINMSLGATLNKNGTLTDADGNTSKVPAIYVQELILTQQRAVDYAHRNGTTVIASAGNDYTNYDGNKSLTKLPGGLNNVVTVSATAPEGYDSTSDFNDYDIPASYTTHGRSLVDVSAPGGDIDVLDADGFTYAPDMILSAGNNNSFYWSAGTSMAAPHVAGVAALIVGKNGKMHPRALAEQLEKSSDKIDGNGQSLFFGKGRINAQRAIAE